MTETKAKYIVVPQQDLDDANAMSGTGYPSVAVEPARKISERRGRRFVETETPAYVKFYTDFKEELADIHPYSLKVFLFIGLSIGFETGVAWPGVRTIAEKTGMNKDTVGKAIADLEQQGFLEVWRKTGSRNEYKPVHFFSVGRLSDETGQSKTTELSDETPKPSGQDAELSDENTELSDASSVKTRNQNNKKKEQEEEEGSPKPKNPLLSDLERAAITVFDGRPDLSHNWKVLQSDLQVADIQRTDHTIAIRGVGDSAPVYQDNYARKFERALVGVCGEELTVKFEA